VQTKSQAASKSSRAAAIETDYESWVRALFPAYVAAPFADRHHALWAWAWAIDDTTRPRPFVAIWPRGGAKSTTAELATVMLGARQTRRYALYVCETQEQADDHVGTIAALLESDALADAYPAMADRLVGKYGASKGWRRNRVRTASGFTVDAIGLDTATRGVKLEDARPDLLILDDIDGGLDSAATTARKIKTITRALLPAGAGNLAVLAVQNLILPGGVFAQLADGRADFLTERIVSGPHPAVRNLATNQVPQPDGRTRYAIVGGEATWAGQSLPTCEKQINEWGLGAFLSEAQHDVEDAGGGMFDHLDFRHCAPGDVPPLVRATVWCDPAVTNTDQSDAHGIQGDGLAADGTIYRMRSWEGRTTPEDVLRRAILLALELGSLTVGVETDQGGDTWQSVYQRAVAALREEGLLGSPPPRFVSAKAGQGHGPKAHRAAQMLPDYERGEIVHVTGTHETLERALRRFPRTKPFDLTDASYWCWWDLRKAPEQAASAPSTADRSRAARGGWSRVP
jgi:hypothetical protein